MGVSYLTELHCTNNNIGDRMKITFKNLERSELAIEAVEERISSLRDKFPSIQSRDITINLSMDNSPIQGGLDVFTVKIHLVSGQYKGVILEKSAPSLYVALASLVESSHERLKRFDEKARKIHRQVKRKKKDLFIEKVLNDENYANIA